MTALFVESSAVLTWAFEQGGWDEIHGRLVSAETLVASTLMFVEARRVVVRGEATSDLDAATSRAVLGRLEQVFDRVMAMEITPAVVQRCARAFPAEPVRTLDAIHLASALEFLDVFPDLRVLSLDRRIRDNATALGLRLA